MTQRGVGLKMMMEVGCGTGGLWSCAANLSGRVEAEVQVVRALRSARSAATAPTQALVIRAAQQKVHPFQMRCRSG